MATAKASLRQHWSKFKIEIVYMSLETHFCLSVANFNAPVATCGEWQQGKTPLLSSKKTHLNRQKMKTKRHNIERLGSTTKYSLHKFSFK